MTGEKKGCGPKEDAAITHDVRCESSTSITEFGSDRKIAVELIRDELAARLPEAMLKAKRWLISIGKQPHYVDGRKRFGELDTAEEAARLGLFEDALHALETNKHADCLGFALGLDHDTGDHWQGLDFDEAIVDGALVHELHRSILARSGDAYAEVSPSGKGLHIIGLGQQFAAIKWKKPGDPCVEAYSAGRFFTVTGRQVAKRRGLPGLSGLVESVRGELAGATKNGGPSRRERFIRASIQATGDYLSRQSTSMRAYLEAHPVEAALSEYGFRQYGNRWCSPKSTSGIPGVMVLDDLRACSFHASDAGIGTTTNGAEVFNSFDLAADFSYGGDRRAAMKALLPDSKEYSERKASRASSHTHNHTTGPSMTAASSDDDAATEGVNAAFCNAQAKDIEADRKAEEPNDGERPRGFEVLDVRTERDGHSLRPGVYFHGEDDPQWVSSPVHVVAVTFDKQTQHSFGRLLRYKNTVGNWHTWAMPMSLLSGRGDEVRSILLDRGVELASEMKLRNLFLSYLQHRPKREIHCATSVGWHDDVFVLPDCAIGPGADNVTFQSSEHHSEFTPAGSLEDWRETIGAWARGNLMMMAAISSAFVGPLLKRCGAESGGIHFVGDSSTGKTSGIEAARSVWGGALLKRSWNATANGLEGAAALCNDGLLVLDEIGEVKKGTEIGAIVYALANGVGKQRAQKTGAAKPVTRWRVFVVSSGERSVRSAMEALGERVKAGQEVRLLSLRADGRTHGAFDDLHGFENGEQFADAIKNEAAKHYGHAGREFLKRLAADGRDMAKYMADFKGTTLFAAAKGDGGQEGRAAKRFALLGLAGELATEYGVTGWVQGEAIAAAGECFSAWRAFRDRPSGNAEQWDTLAAVQSFLHKHGDSRFSDARGDDDRVVVRDRAGWWRSTAAGREYLFTSTGLREALQERGGVDFRRAVQHLVELGVTDPAGSDGKTSRPERINGVLTRVYTINQARLDAALARHDAADGVQVGSHVA